MSLKAMLLVQWFEAGDKVSDAKSNLEYWAESLEDSKRKANIAQAEFTALDERLKHEFPDLYQWTKRDKPVWVIRDSWKDPSDSDRTKARFGGSGMTEGADYLITNCQEEEMYFPGYKRPHSALFNNTIGIPLGLLSVIVGGPLAK